jgi:hypothetical protein
MERHPTERGWAAKLSRPIVLKDGTPVATLADARSFILRQPNHIQERRAWQRAAEHGGDIEAATARIELALLLEARYLRP